MENCIGARTELELHEQFNAEAFTDNADVIVQTDGGAFDNPGPAGLGIVFFVREENTYIERAAYSIPIGYMGTNNLAEYIALIKAM